MKLVITVDLSSDGKLFVKNAPKCLKRAVRAVCWPFDADVHVKQIKETVKTQGKTARGKGEKKNGPRTRVAGRSKGQTGENS